MNTDAHGLEILIVSPSAKKKNIGTRMNTDYTDIRKAFSFAKNRFFFIRVYLACPVKREACLSGVKSACPAVPCGIHL